MITVTVTAEELEDLIQRAELGAQLADVWTSVPEGYVVDDDVLQRWAARAQALRARAAELAALREKAGE